MQKNNTVSDLIDTLQMMSPEFTTSQFKKAFEGKFGLPDNSTVIFGSFLKRYAHQQVKGGQTYRRKGVFFPDRQTTRVGTPVVDNRPEPPAKTVESLRPAFEASIQAAIDLLKENGYKISITKTIEV